MKKKFSFRCGSIELRSCDKFLIQALDNTTAEIVLWGKADQARWCITLAFWAEAANGYRLEFVGDRPFMPDVDSKDFWFLAEKGQKLLDSATQ